VPETPTQAHTLVSSNDDLAARLTDGEVEEGAVTWPACQSQRLADDVRAARGQVPAESAGEEIRRRRLRRWAAGVT
jgi:hypothetical protein